MTHCPHCNAICNPLRFYLMNRRNPWYNCPKCHKKSRYSRRSFVIVFVIAGLVVIFSLLIFFKLRLFGIIRYLNSTWSGLFFLLAIVPILVTFLMWIFVRLDPVPEETGRSGNIHE